MQGSQSNREAESSLYTLMEFNKFDMIKELLRDRLKIVWCTRLERADHDERKRLEVSLSSSLLYINTFYISQNMRLVISRRGHIWHASCSAFPSIVCM